jgi:hypothetical protein
MSDDDDGFSKGFGYAVGKEVGGCFSSILFILFIVACLLGGC